MTDKPKIVILGSGFGGVYTALELEKTLKNRDDFDVILVNQENFLLFTPMLHEVAASDIDPTDIVNPIHKLLKKVQFFCGSVDAIELNNRKVIASHGATKHSHELSYDHLVLALGSVSHFYDLPGLEENSLTMKSLGDAIYLRNQIIALLEEADFDCCKDIRERLLTFVVAGGGFAGVETIAAAHDYARCILPFYRNLKESDLRFVLVTSGSVLLPELDEKLGKYAGDLLSKRGIEVRYNTKVTGYMDHKVTLSDGSNFDCSTLVWTAGITANPLIANLACDNEKGRIKVLPTLKVEKWEGVWALGDCACIPNLDANGIHPPTAQHAIREARIVAKNIAAEIRGGKLQSFRYKPIGQLASLGNRKGIAQIFGFRFSGFIAWWIWRTTYLLKLPRFEKRFRVALNWTLDLLFSKDIVQLPTIRSKGISKE
ncbi:MAG: NAD(P)/FAD-dependent oxidoreductase [Chlamydiales bacterium]